METLNLENWKFSLEGDTDPWVPDFDDRFWEDVVVPHDWAVSFPFSVEHSSGTGYLPGGTGWYRTVFRAGPVNGKRAFIRFGGVYKNSQVWCNGYYLGRRPGGYYEFRYDISHCLREGDNVIAVKVSHENTADSRWYTGSGIYRRVFVEIHDPVYIEADSLVLTGVPEEGRIIVSGDIVNTCGERAKAELRVRIDGEEKAVESGLEVPEGGAVPFSLSIPLSGPRLWSAEDPKLYRVGIELRAAAGGREFFYRAPPVNTGLRSIRFDPDRGFFINGNNEKLRGVCFHHDSGCLGAAFWPDVWRRRLEKLKTMGCNAVRMSHNPQAGELYDLCDEMGFYVMDEAFDEWEGCKNKWVRGHNVYPPAHYGYYEDFPQWHERDLAAMVIRGRNHPSVIMWSIGNEIDYPNDPYVHPLFAEMAGNNDAKKPKAEREYNPLKPNMERLAVIAGELAGIVKKYDKSRPVLTAAAFPELSSRIGFFDSLDLVGYNYKERLYEADHKRFPRLPILGSENGHHLEAWKAVRDRDYISGQFLWTGIDFLGEARGWPVRGSLAGLLDTGGFEKTGYYRRRALWSDKPFAYLVTALREDAEKERPSFYRSWNYRPGEQVTVTCYTSRGPVELFLNGKSLGSRDCGEDFPAWTVSFERGTLEARGPGSTDTLESTLPAVQFRLNRWEASPGTGAENASGPRTAPGSGNLPGAGARSTGARSTGKGSPPPSAYRIAQAELELLDGDGRLCVRENPRVRFSLSGEGKILGIENGDLSDLTEYRAPWRRVYRGRLIVYVLLPAASGGARLEASAEEFPTASVDL
ncbi:MAG: DUF4982 domain-containing protein [Treponema sp.]|jgi:hypothetical protein|nr:DUF4982 domain-containing protein [Treponema sp.]